MAWEKHYVRKWTEVLVFSFLAGLIGGLGAVVFRFLIAVIHWFFFGKVLPLMTLQAGGFNLGYILLPTAGALIVGLIVRWYPEIRGNGIPEVIEAVIFRGETSLGALP